MHVPLNFSRTESGHLEPDYADAAIVLSVKPTDGRPRAVMLTFAGQLGYAGMNEHGVAKVCECAVQLRAACRTAALPTQADYSRAEGCSSLRKIRLD